MHPGIAPNQQPEQAGPPSRRSQPGIILLTHSSVSDRKYLHGPSPNHSARGHVDEGFDTGPHSNNAVAAASHLAPSDVLLGLVVVASSRCRCRPVRCIIQCQHPAGHRCPASLVFRTPATSRAALIDPPSSGFLQAGCRPPVRSTSSPSTPAFQRVSSPQSAEQWLRHGSRTNQQPWVPHSTPPHCPLLTSHHLQLHQQWPWMGMPHHDDMQSSASTLGSCRVPHNWAKTR